MHEVNLEDHYGDLLDGKTGKGRRGKGFAGGTGKDIAAPIRRRCSSSFGWLDLAATPLGSAEVLDGGGFWFEARTGEGFSGEPREEKMSKGFAGGRISPLQSAAARRHLVTGSRRCSSGLGGGARWWWVLVRGKNRGRLRW
ncbi:uncharacterized protein DS421_16g529330 [Arachis hypogaea]|nr:uncharacterized protein DS421_16g529330 [Arachis hypogaea]